MHIEKGKDGKPYKVLTNRVTGETMRVSYKPIKRQEPKKKSDDK
jgi:hypothetical protein